MPFNVLYDVSLWGLAEAGLVYKTGLVRVVENQARLLREDDSCAVTFCAGYSAEAMVHTAWFLNTNRLLRDVPFAHRVPPTYWSAVHRMLHAKIQQSTNRRLLLRALRKAVRASMRLTYGRPPRLDPATLAATDIFHSPFHPIPRQVRECNRVATFLSVHDLIPILFPQFCGAGAEPFMKEVVNHLTPSDWVIANSNATKNDLCNCRQDLDTEKVKVIYLAASDHFAPITNQEIVAATLRKYNVPRLPYFLSLNTLEPRKNIEFLIQTFARLVQQEKLDDLRLVLAGPRGWKYQGIFGSLASQPYLKDHVILTGFVPDWDLPALYSGACAFVFPSLYEGFGLPVLEAMQCGSPVITSNTSSLPEVVGDAGILIDPRDSDAWCQAMLSVYHQSSLREAMRKKSLERAQQFSWAKNVQETLAAYRLAMQSGL